MQRNEKNTGWSLETLSKVLNKLEELCEADNPVSLSINAVKLIKEIPEIKEIIGNDEELKQIFEEATTASEEYKPLSRSQIIDIIIDEWFSQKAVQLVSDTNFKMHNYDIRSDLLEYSYELARKMSLAHIEHVRPENTEIYYRFFKSNDPKTVYCRNACPLIQNGNVYKFVTKNLTDYFVARSMLDEMRHTYKPSSM